LRQILISGQVWLTVVLVAGAFLFTRSLRNLQMQPLGMNTENVVTAELTLGQQKHSHPTQRLAFFEQLEARLKQLPGISSVALSDSLPPNAPARTMPLIALVTDVPVVTPEQGIGGVVGWRSVTPDYFSVLNIPLLRGRAFEETDRKPGDGVIVLNQALAARLFPGQDPLGKTIRFRMDEQHLTQTLSVVGVTGNTQNRGLVEQAAPEYYVVRRHAADDVVFRYPDSQRINIVVKSAIDPQTIANELRNAVSALDPTLPVQSSTMGQSISTLAARPRFSAALLGLFAGVGLLLAAAGIYGLIALLVSQRTREIAIRVALGASPKSVIQMMVSRISIWIGLGAAAGIICSLLAARWVGSLLFGIKPNDPTTLAEAAIVLFMVALIAAYIPARRAAKVDPMVALRYE
jgi:predicted permease